MFWENLRMLLAVSLGFNITMYIIAYLKQSDKLTDISYALTFFVINFFGFISSDKDVADILIFTVISLWSIRIGSYLLFRIFKIGRDKRFDIIRQNPISFLGFWLMQGLTCAFVSLASYLSYKTIGDPKLLPLIIGLALSLFGLILESLADQQKFQFKLKHPKEFMTIGVWKHLRHPNYTGEILFWIGVFIMSISQIPFYLGILSPIWISFILIKFSGIPILEKSWELRYKLDQKYQVHKQNSWRLIPFIY